mmetsp:Transcript_7644/g.21698  ORF Transcript_7644/g.21698 Transcript_7644/m.21698 type:complete len:398 (+) Transcript_7644:99-1292(+)
MASYMTMPLLIFNLGGEMIYVLRQRLGAQAIDQLKAQQVLNEVTASLFDEKFITALFCPQRLLSFAETKAIFRRIAHCSIMKLNETSMGKLYDLMTMVFKFQVLGCRSPKDILQVTKLHLNTIRSYVNASVRTLIDSCQSRLDKTYGKWPLGRFWPVRQTLLDFCHNRNVKVSLLLQENLQRQNARMVVCLNGPCPKETRLPGTVRHFGPSGDLIDEYRTAGIGLFDIAAPTEYDEERYEQVQELYGANLYSKFRGTESSSVPETESKENDRATDEEKAQMASEELKHLAALIKPARHSSGFRLNLFAAANDSLEFVPSTENEDSACDGKVTDESDIEHDEVFIDARAARQTIQQRFDDLDLERVESGGAKVADDEDFDLLEMMDRAVASGAPRTHK